MEIYIDDETKLTLHVSRCKATSSLILTRDIAEMHKKRQMNRHSFTFALSIQWMT